MTMHPFRRMAATAALFAAALLASCESPTGGGAAAPAVMDVVSGGTQQGVVGEELPQPLVVRVVDAQGNPVSGQIVNFRVISGGGSVFAGAAITGSDGIARERWILGTVAADSQRVEARAVDRNNGEAQVFAVFRATAAPGPAAAITPVSGSGLTGTPGMPLADSLGARVADRFGNPVRAVTVAWAVTRGGGSVSPPTSATDTAGIARTQWVLGSWSDSTQTVQAAAGAGLTTMFVASTGIPAGAALTVVSGSGQSGVVGTALAQPLVVRLTLADGRPVPGAPVTWAVSGGTVTPSVSTTDAQGMASAQWVMPSAPGTATATATTPGVMPAGFTATVLAGPAARLEILGGDGQVCYADQRCAQTLAVRALDAAGNDLPDARVDWEVLDQGYLSDVFNDRLGGRTLRTYGTPFYRAHFTPTGGPGTRRIRVTSGSAQATFTITVPATRLVLHAPSPTARYGDSVWVAVDAYSSSPITSVTARVGDRQIALTHYSGARYHGTLRMDGLPRGRYEVVITVNAQGVAPDSVVAPFILDRKPVVTVLAPAENTVTTGTVHLHATCQDDDPGGCKSLTVAGITGTSVIDQNHTFTQEGAYTLSFVGTDSAGQRDTEVRHGWVTRTSRWTQVAEVHGVHVLDADDSRVLFMTGWEGPQSLARVLNRNTGDTTTIAVDPIAPGRLTPAGALGFRRLNRSCCDLYDWRGGTTVSRGGVGGNSDGNDTIHVEGNWALWRGLGLYRQNIATGAVQQITTQFARGFDLGENGDVVWATNANAPQIVRWRDGVVTALTVEGDGGHVNQRPKTDGINTAYVRLYTDGPALVLNGPDDREILARPPFHVSADSLKFDLRGGWTAFRKWGDDGVPRLWMRSPAGALQQASTQRLDGIHAMGPRGQVIYASGGRLYYTAPPFSGAVDVGPASYRFGDSFPQPVRVVWPGETPYALMGRYVFRIDL